MTLDSEKPIIRCGDKRLTISEAESALEHAAAFIRLAASQDDSVSVRQPENGLKSMNREGIDP